MNPSKLSASILQKIKNEDVKPLPKAHFWFKNIMWWLTFLASIVLGGAGLAVIIFAIVHQRIDLIDFATDQTFGTYIAMLPFFWIFFFGVFIWMSLWGIQHTKKAYKIPRIFLIFLNVFLTLVVSSTIYGLQKSETVEHFFSQRMPYLENIRDQRANRWKKMEQRGIFAGEILSRDEKIAEIRSISGKIYRIDITNLGEKSALITVGNHFGFRGKPNQTGTINATKVRPLPAPGDRKPFPPQKKPRR